MSIHIILFHCNLKGSYIIYTNPFHLIKIPKKQLSHSLTKILFLNSIHPANQQKKIKISAYSNEPLIGQARGKKHV
jgi:hypothetical protein